MKTLIHILVFISTQFLIANSLNAQVSNLAKVNPRAVKMYNEGLAKATEDRYDDAISYFLQAIYLDSNYVDAYLSLAGVYGQTRKPDLSVEYYEKALRKDSAATKVYRLPYAINLAGTGNFNKALHAIDEYLANQKLGEASRKAGEYRKRCFEFAIAQEKKNAGRNYEFAPKNAGDRINSAESEYLPCLTIDGKEFFFTRRLRGFDEDFFSAKWDGKDWINIH